MPRDSEDRGSRASLPNRWGVSGLECEREGGEGTGEFALVGMVVYDFLFRRVRSGEDTARHDDSWGT